LPTSMQQSSLIPRRAVVYVTLGWFSASTPRQVCSSIQYQ